MRVRDHAYLRTAGAVKRMHTIRMRGQTLAEHSWGVIMLILAVDPLASGSLLAAAAVHDLPEFRTGDTPATAKWDYPELEQILRSIEQKWYAEYDLDYLNNLSEEERKLLKWADRAELAWQCLEELKSGNSYALEVLHNILGAIKITGVPPNVRCHEMMEQLTAEAQAFTGTTFYQRSKHGRT